MTFIRLCAALLLAMVAGSASEIVVLSQNVWFDDVSGSAGRYERLLTELARRDADVVALQEVTPACFAILTAQAVQHGWHISGTVGADYANITVSRLPIRETRSLRLPSRMQRQALITTVIKDEQPLRIINIHLDSMLDDTQRRILQLHTILADQADDQFLIVGDCNFGDGEPEEAIIAHLGDAGGNSGTLTFSVDTNAVARANAFAGERSRRLDRILAPRTMILSDYAVIVTGLSDHEGIVARVRF